MARKECETHIRLSRAVCRAIYLVYGLLDHQKALGKSSELTIQIAEARKAGRVAIKALLDHCKAHRCKIKAA
jgi:hypothetical protein